jgi:general secretion pathway protein A
MSRDRARLVLGGSEREVAVTEMGLRWSGGYTVLWRPPVGYVDSVFPGDSSPVVGWVAERLRVVLPDTAGRAAPYGRDLERVVKKFQYERGLVPDGVIGVQTLIQLAAAFGEAPLLHPDKEGQ